MSSSLYLLPFFSFVLVLLLSSVQASASWEKRTLGEDVSYFEPFFVNTERLHASHLRRRDELDLSPLFVSFDAFGRSFNLELSPSKNLFSPQFKSEIHIDGIVRPVLFDKSQFYQGHIQDTKNSSYPSVSAQIADGFMHASIFITKEKYMIEPLSNHFPEHRTKLASVLENHIIYRLSDVTFNFSNTAAHASPSTPGMFFEGPSFGDILSRQETELGKIKYQGSQRSRRTTFDKATMNTCEMALVADHLFYGYDGQGSESRTASILVNWLSSISLIYRRTDFTGVGLGIQFALRQMTIYTSSNDTNNPYTASTPEAQGFLDIITLGDKTLGNWNHVCLAHAFTHRDFNSGILGLAWVGTTSGLGICHQAAPGGKSYNTGISTTLNDNTDLTSIVSIITFAHENGHNFGSTHDVTGLTSSGGSNCAPGGSFGNYIMYERATDGLLANNDDFSQCSKDIVGPVIAARAPICFSNIGSEPICGNGVIEGLEECDCGQDPTDTSNSSITACHKRDPCCSLNCTLAVGAECSPKYGSCCNSSCNMVGFDLELDGSIPTGPFSAPLSNSLADGGYLCGASTECTTPQYCVKYPLFRGKCPSSDWIYSPSNPRVINPIPGCNGSDCFIQYLDPMVKPCVDETNSSLDCYFYHKSDHTLCGQSSGVCQHNGCRGSICQLFSPTNESGVIPPQEFVDAFFAAGNTVKECFAINSSDISQDCNIFCEFETGVCVSTFAYSLTPHGNATNVTGKYRTPGRPCGSYSGYCAAGGVCISAGNDSPLNTLLSLNFQSWIEKNWYVVVGLAVGLVLLFLFLNFVHSSKIDARKDNEVKLDNSKPYEKQVPRYRGVCPLDPHLYRISDYAPLSRLKRFFPSVEDPEVLIGIISRSENEEEAVNTLLGMGYPFADYNK